MKFITRHWYNESTPPAYLQAMSRLYARIHAKRQAKHIRESNLQQRSPVPVIVIGNISVGGTGKTPMVIAVAQYLSKHGYRVGIISRGYKGKSKRWPVQVTSQSTSDMVGDEPMMIFTETNLPVVVGPKRNRDIEFLLRKNRDVNVILSDDGMQHYAMIRDIEIAVIDGERMFGNKHLLPAGPLREPLSRLNSVDMRVFNGNEASEVTQYSSDHDFIMHLVLSTVYRLGDKTKSRLIDEFKGQKVHAVAGIGHPQRFFKALKDVNIQVIEHVFPDHYDFKEGDLNFNDKLPVLMTEKDAVKCEKYALDNCWVVSVSAELCERFYQSLLVKLVNTKIGKKYG